MMALVVVAVAVALLQALAVAAQVALECLEVNHE